MVEWNVQWRLININFCRAILKWKGQRTDGFAAAQFNYKTGWRPGLADNRISSYIITRCVMAENAKPMWLLSMRRNQLMIHKNAQNQGITSIKAGAGFKWAQIVTLRPGDGLPVDEVAKSVSELKRLMARNHPGLFLLYSNLVIFEAMKYSIRILFLPSALVLSSNFLRP